MRAVRLCSRKHSTLDGIGASITVGRWNSPGKPVTYLASCDALAILEYLVHLKTLPKDMVLMLVEIRDTLEIQKTEWLASDSKAIRQIGDEWIVSKVDSNSPGSICSRPTTQELPHQSCTSSVRRHQNLRDNSVCI